MYSRRRGATKAPHLPLRRQQPPYDGQKGNGVDNDEEGMGAREDTSMIPLESGQVRIPKVQPPVIMGRWASVTQTGELFPSDFPDPISPPSSSTHPPPPQAQQHRQTADKIINPVDLSSMGTPSSPLSALEEQQHKEHVSLEMGFLEMERRVSDMLMGDEHIVHGPSTAAAAGPMPAGISASSSSSTLNIHRIAEPGCGIKLGRITDHRPNYLFLPPPPPPLDTSHGPGGSLHSAADENYTSLVVAGSSPLMHKKMMRWYQMVELWCVERERADEVEEAANASTCAAVPREVDDSERAIVAPPPRPPMFSEDVAPHLLVRKMAADYSRIHAPYTFDRWVTICWCWWQKVAASFETLRDVSKYSGFAHVSKGPPAQLWEPKDVLGMIALSHQR